MEHTDPSPEALERVSAALRRLLDRVRRTTAPAEVLREVETAVDRITDRLDPHAHPGPFSQLAPPGQLPDPVRFDGSDPMALFPYSPLIGLRNPIAPPLHFEVRGDSLHGEGQLGPLYAGPPGAVHGGIVAAILDELLGAVNIVNQAGAFTGTLTVRYRAMTPLGEPLTMEARHDGTADRKSFASGRIVHAGRVTAEAEGVFIRPGSASWGGPSRA